MAVCCCSLAGTAACQHCSQNPFATDIWSNTITTDYVKMGETIVHKSDVRFSPKTNADRGEAMQNDRDELWGYLYNAFAAIEQALIAVKRRTEHEQKLD